MIRSFPEPSTALLLASGLVAMAVGRRQRQFRTLANGVLGLAAVGE